VPAASPEEMYNGHSFEVEHLGAPTLFIDGASYALRRIMTRTPAEHMLDGRRYALEIQLMHEPEGAGQHQHAAVGVSVLFDERLEGSPPGFVSKLASAAPDATRVARQLVHGLTFSEINAALGQSLKEYYRYPGSLTNPPCTEGVAWFVARHPLPVKEEDVRRFRMSEGDNARPPQPLNARTVQYIA